MHKKMATTTSKCLKTNKSMATKKIVHANTEHARENAGRLKRKPKRI